VEAVRGGRRPRTLQLSYVFADVVDAARCGESRGMIGLAAEIADGIVFVGLPVELHPRRRVPEITEVRRAAGLDLTGFGVLAAVPAAARDDADTALQGIRTELHRYFDCLSTVRCSTRQATATMSPPFDATTASPSRAISGAVPVGLVRHWPPSDDFGGSRPGIGGPGQSIR
jgi:alkanesulfonate monooxygenase SsuD/methylene tetrahydromethanopterin reductase-like flavin-dependent oxidoreductase (luciferase family)